MARRSEPSSLETVSSKSTVYASLPSGSPGPLIEAEAPAIAKLATARRTAHAVSCALICSASTDDRERLEPGVVADVNRRSDDDNGVDGRDCILAVDGRFPWQLGACSCVERSDTAGSPGVDD